MAMQEYKGQGGKKGEDADGVEVPLKNPGDKFLGIYLGSETFPSKKYKNRTHTKHKFEKEDGTKFFVWGDKALNDDLPGMGVGSFIEGEFLGKIVLDNGNNFRQYKFRYEKAEPNGL